MERLQKLLSFSNLELGQSYADAANLRTYHDFLKDNLKFLPFKSCYIHSLGYQ